MTPEARKELETRIEAARKVYYNGPQPETRLIIIDGYPLDVYEPISDEEFDGLITALAKEDASNPAVTAIGSPAVSEWSKVKHEIPMGSLGKVNDPEELSEWISAYAPGAPLLWTEKLDGISIHLKFSGGKLIKAVTRGDGHIGENITQNVARMKGIPQKLPQKFTGSVRGEVVLLKSDLASWFPEYGKSTRSAAAGIAKRYDGKGCEHLSVFTYRVSEGKDLKTEQEQFEFLRDLGLTVPNWGVCSMQPGE